jgi:hypothetical protein
MAFYPTQILIWLNLLFSSSLVVAQELPRDSFLVPKDQKQLFLESVKRRADTGPRFFDCARIYYGKPALLKTPLDSTYYSILKRYQSSMTPARENTLSVINGWGGVACQSMWGYCMAYTQLARDLNLLLHFDPHSPRPKWSADKWESVLADTWIQKRPLIVPGFTDLHQWSSQKETLSVLSKMIPWVWGDLASIPAIALQTTFESRSPMLQQEAQQAVNELTQLRSKGYLPIVYLGAKRDAQFATTGFSMHPQEALLQNASLQDHPYVKNLLNTYLHVVQFMSAEFQPNGVIQLKFIDPNLYAPKNVSTLTIDFNQPKPLLYKTDAMSIHLDRFGSLPGDVAHMDEIVSNLVDAMIENPKEVDRLRPLLDYSPATK